MVLSFLAFFHVSFPLSNTPDPSELVSDYFLKKINSFIIELVIKLLKFKEIKQKTPNHDTAVVHTITPISNPLLSIPFPAHAHKENQLLKKPLIAR